MKRNAAALFLVALIVGVASAQSPVPPRDKIAPLPGGSGRIIGRVFAADTGNPLARAQVQITSPALGSPRQLMTDADGRYEAPGLGAGRYKISVTRLGFVPLEYGQKHPFQPGRDLELLDGQTLDRIDFALSRGGVITGRITDQNGEPQAGIAMQALRFVWRAGGVRQPEPTNARLFDRIVTDDLGQFRIYGLMPGSYIVAADGMHGMLPGRHQATTYFPGTTNVDEAQMVEVSFGQEVPVHFAISAARLARLSGTILDSGGRPVGWRSIRLTSRTESSVMVRSGETTRPDGTFEIGAVAPGNYTIEVSPLRTEPNDSGFVSFPISVDGFDITDLMISMKRSGTVTGRVVWEGRSPHPFATLRITPAAADPRMTAATVVSAAEGSGTVDATGNFSIVGVHGNVVFRTSFVGRAEPWSLKAVRFGGADITDTGYDVSGDVDGIEIVMTDRGTRVSGSAQNARYQPATDYVVVFLPREEKPNVNPTRFVQTARPDQQGRYQIKDLPPGQYVAAAIESLNRDGHYDPAFQKRMRSIATPFTLKEGEQLELDLPLMR